MDERPYAHTVTGLSSEVRDGTQAAVEELFEHVYGELRERARKQRHRWKGEPSLQTTALVNEAYLKLVDAQHQSWQSRSHFLAVASRAMRQILIDQARRMRAQKRGGDVVQLSLEELADRLGREVAMTEEDAEAFVVLDEALDRLAGEHPRAAQGVECRFFGGMTIEETAEVLEASQRTVTRDWKLAKVWLYREMKRLRGEKAAKTESSSA